MFADGHAMPVTGVHMGLQYCSLFTGFYDSCMTHREDAITCEGLFSSPLRLFRSVIQFSAGVKVLENDENDGDISITAAAADCGRLGIRTRVCDALGLVYQQTIFTGWDTMDITLKFTVLKVSPGSSIGDPHKILVAEKTSLDQYSL